MSKQPQGKFMAKSYKNVGKKLYTPEHYQFADRHEQLHFISRYPLAQIVTVVPSAHQNPAIEATITPLFHQGSDLELNFIGHIAKRNIQSQRIADGADVLALFLGPQAYVSPNWFNVENTVPTWNYVALQLRGTLCIENDHRQLMHTLRITCSHMESEHFIGDTARQWNMDSVDPKLVDKLSHMVTAFSIKGVTLEGVKRLSQDKDYQDMQSIMAGLRQDNQPASKEIVKLMENEILKNSR